MSLLTLQAKLAAALIILLTATSAIAAPPGDSRHSDVGKKLFSFNVLAVPQDNWSANDTTCSNSGHRIFFRRVQSGSIGSITWTLDPAAAQNFKITDCDGTSDGTGAVLVNEQLSVYVMIRVVGKKSDSLTLTCADIIDMGTDDLCLIDSETFNKGKSFTKIMSNVFDNELEQVLWTLETTTGFRNAQVWVFEKLF
jgi:hypothetical protein